MKCAAITGANGFVGRAVTRSLLDRGVFVYAIDLQQEAANPHENLAYICCDVANIGTAAESIQKAPDVFFAFAWAGSAGPYRADYALQLNNAKYNSDCIVFAKNIGCSRFVGAGSITETETFEAVRAQGNKPALPYIYGAGKAVAHEIGKCVAAGLGIDFLWAYITNAYGPGESSPRLLNTTIRKLLSGEAAEFTAATQLYDFVYINDVAEAFCRIAESGRPFHEYTIGSGGAKPLRVFLEGLRDAVSPGAALHFGAVPFTGIDLAPEVFDIASLTRDTGFVPKVAFSEGVVRTAAWIAGDGQI